MNIELIEIKKLKPATYNPRQISTKQYQDLKKSIEKFDLVDPIIINKDHTVIGGHQRLKVCKELKYKDVDCVILDLTKEQERELNVRLNKNTGAFDMDILANEFDIDELTEWGFKHIDLGLNIDKIDSPDNIETEYPFATELDITNNYIVLKFDNDIDWIQAKTVFELKTETARRTNGKSWSSGIGRVLNGAEAIKKIQNES
tara:strand:- start:12548 stop:13153 length:606 start_codon:yes stop_codon:yes gene_type:complete